MAEEKPGTSSEGDNPNESIEKLSADEMRQSEIVRKTPAQKRLIIGIAIAGIIAMTVVAMSVAP